jgi:hypothetical protein
VKLGEDFLIDARVVIGLPAIDHDKTVSQLVLDHRLNDDVEEILDILIIGQAGIELPYREGFRPFKSFQEIDQ